MFVPRHLTKPIFYACPGSLQMFFDKIISPGQPLICKAVQLLTVFLKNLHDLWVCTRLPGLIIYPIISGRDNYIPSTGIFKIGTIANTDGRLNCLRQPRLIRNHPNVYESNFHPLIKSSVPWPILLPRQCQWGCRPARSCHGFCRAI